MNKAQVYFRTQRLIKESMWTQKQLYCALPKEFYKFYASNKSLKKSKKEKFECYKGWMN